MVKYAKRLDAMDGSELGDILKLIAKPDIISFAGGLPAPELFPVENLKKAAIAVMEEMGNVVCQYSASEGYLPLRQKLVDRMAKKNNIKVTTDNVLITSGSQQGLDLVARTFIDKDDVILMESPSYLGAISAFKGCEPKFVEVPTDEHGMIMPELEKILETTKNVKMIYVIPEFQNPTGISWTLERRKQLMEIVNRYEIPVVEDNPYGDLRFENETIPALKSMDTKGLVVYLGTLSKVMVPGFRIGWMCASEELFDKFNTLKQGVDLQSSTLTQMQADKYMDMFDLDEHVDMIREIYKKRRDLMLDMMDKHFPKEAKYIRPEGGLFAWVVLPDYIDSKKMLVECIEKKVAYVPGNSFYPSGKPLNCFRLNYSNSSEEKIEEGIKAIGEVIKANLK